LFFWIISWPNLATFERDLLYHATMDGLSLVYFGNGRIISECGSKGFTNVLAHNPHHGNTEYFDGALAIQRKTDLLISRVVGFHLNMWSEFRLTMTIASFFVAFFVA